jgi:hypothetical protein
MTTQSDSACGSPVTVGRCAVGAKIAMKDGYYDDRECDAGSEATVDGT